MAEEKPKPKVFDSSGVAVERAIRVLAENALPHSQAMVKAILTQRDKRDPERLRFFPSVVKEWGARRYVKIVYFDPLGKDFEALVIKAAEKFMAENKRTSVINMQDVKSPGEWED